MSTFSGSPSVSGAASAGMTVPANSYVVASYGPSATYQDNVVSAPGFSLYFGPGQTVPSALLNYHVNTGIPPGVYSYHYFLGGVQFTND